MSLQAYNKLLSKVTEGTVPSETDIQALGIQYPVELQGDTFIDTAVGYGVGHYVDNYRGGVIVLEEPYDVYLVLKSLLDRYTQEVQDEQALDEDPTDSDLYLHDVGIFVKQLKPYVGKKEAMTKKTPAERISHVIRVLTASFGIANIYEGEYPELDDIEALGLTYPHSITVNYQGLNTAAIRSAAKKLGLMSGDEIKFDNADDVYDLFSTMGRAIDNHLESIEDTEYDTEEEKDQDRTAAYEPAVALAQILGWKFQ